MHLWLHAQCTRMQYSEVEIAVVLFMYCLPDRVEEIQQGFLFWAWTLPGQVLWIKETCNSTSWLGIAKVTLSLQGCIWSVVWTIYLSLFSFSSAWSNKPPVACFLKGQCYLPCYLYSLTHFHDNLRRLNELPSWPVLWNLTCVWEMGRSLGKGSLFLATVLTQHGD